MKAIVDVVFERPVVTFESKRALEEVNKYQGHKNIWFVGSYTVFTVPLLESGVYSSVKVAEALGVDVRITHTTYYLPSYVYD